MELQPRWGLSGPSWNEEVESKRGKIWHRSQRQQLGIKHWRGWNSGCLCSLSSTLLLWIVFFLCWHFHRHFLGFLYLFCLCKLWIVSQPGFWTFCLPFQDIVIRWQHSCRKKKQINFIIPNQFDHENVTLGCFGDCKISILTKDPLDQIFLFLQVNYIYGPKIYANLLFQLYVGSSSIFLGSHYTSPLLKLFLATTEEIQNPDCAGLLISANC